jgi:hypothetical protein
MEMVTSADSTPRPKTARKPRVSKKERKRVKASRARLGQARTEPVSVSSPTVPGATDIVQKAVDPLFALRKKGRITEGQFLAGEVYRRGFNATKSRLGGSMDFDRVRSSTPGSGGYSAAELDALKKLREGQSELGQFSSMIVRLVVGEEWSVGRVAAHFYGVKSDRKASGHDHDYVTRTLKDGLEILAFTWGITNNRPAFMRGWRDDGAKPSGGQAGNREIEVTAKTMGRKT